MSHLVSVGDDYNRNPADMPLSGIRVFVIMPMDETDQQRDQEQEAAGRKEKRTVPVGVSSDRIRCIREAVQSPFSIINLQDLL